MNDVKNNAMSGARVYGFGAVIRNIVSFIMLPIYTKYLSPSDYGEIELLSMMLDVIGLIVGLRVEDAVFKFYHEAKTHERQGAVITSAYMATVAANFLGVIFLVVFSYPLSDLMFGHPGYYQIAAIFASSLLFQALSYVPMAYLRIQQRPWLFVAISVGRLLLQLSLNIYFVVIQDMKVEGVVYSAVISSAIVGVLTSIYLLKNIVPRFDVDLTKSMVRFSGPLILASIAAFYSTYGDRYFLRVYGGLAQVGIYSLAYKFGFLLMSTVWESFTKVWDVRRYQLFHGGGGGETYNDNFIVMVGVMIFGALGISLFLEDLLHIMASSGYWEAAHVAPIVLLAYVVQSLMNFNCFPLYANGRTADIARGQWICAAAITVGYVCLIPGYGMYGAAWATVLGFLCNFVWVVMRGRRLLDMQLNWVAVIWLLAVATALYACSLFVVGNWVAQFIFKVGLALIFVAVFIFWLTGFQRRLMASFFRR